MVAYSKHSINAQSPNVAAVSLNLRIGPLKGFPSPTWCQTPKTTGQARDSHRSRCRGTPRVWLPIRAAGAWPGPPPSLPPAPSTFQSLTHRRKPAKQLVFMNRNSIGGDSSGLGWVRRRRRHKEPLQPGIASPQAAAGAAFIV